MTHLTLQKAYEMAIVAQQRPDYVPEMIERFTHARQVKGQVTTEELRIFAEAIAQISPGLYTRADEEYQLKYDFYQHPDRRFFTSLRELDFVALHVFVGKGQTKSENTIWSFFNQTYGRQMAWKELRGGNFTFSNDIGERLKTGSRQLDLSTEMPVAWWLDWEKNDAIHETFVKVTMGSVQVTIDENTTIHVLSDSIVLKYALAQLQLPKPYDTDASDDFKLQVGNRSCDQYRADFTIDLATQSVKYFSNPMYVWRNVF
jgi:hypothetical protein